MFKRTTVRLSTIFLGITIGLGLVATTTAATPYPKKGQKLTIVVPWDAGGAVDVTMRVFQPALADELGIPVQIVNQPGGGSQAGVTKCSVAKPDGYTLCAHSLPSTNMTYLLPERKAPYNRESFIPVGTIAVEFGSIVVAKDSPYQTINDLIADAKARPGKVRVGNAGRFTNAHIDLLTFQRATEVDVAPVFFSGGAPGVTALLGGHIEALSSTPSNYMGQYKSGDVRVLGIMSDEPSPLLPGAPTFASSGHKVSGFTTRTLALQAGVPPEAVLVLEAAIERAANTLAFRAKLAGLGAELRYLNGKESSELWARTDASLTTLLSEATR